MLTSRLHHAHKFDMFMEGVREKIRTNVIINQVVKVCSLHGFIIKDSDKFVNGRSEGKNEDKSNNRPSGRSMLTSRLYHRR